MCIALTCSTVDMLVDHRATAVLTLSQPRGTAPDRKAEEGAQDGAVLCRHAKPKRFEIHDELRYITICTAKYSAPSYTELSKINRRSLQSRRR